MKRTLDELAIFGGAPRFDEPLHVGRPNVGDRENLLQRIEDLLDRRWFTNRGPFVIELEERIAARLGVRHCITVCNATVGLEVTARALALTGEVIVPSFTFIASAHALEWLGITPIFCDIDENTHNLDPARVEELITSNTSAILGVHVWGRSCDVEALSEIASRRHLKLIFDAAHAFDCAHAGSMIGNFGDAEIFSFHATKFFNTFEGGAITTNDDELAEKIRLMINFGFAGYDKVVSVGTNAKMNEVSAAMGLTSLEALAGFVSANQENYLRYKQRLADIPGLAVIEYDPADRPNYQYLVVEVYEKDAGLSRDEICRALWMENVFARRYFYPGCHQTEPYRSRTYPPVLPLPVTERITRQVLSLPTGTAVTSETVDEVCALIRLLIQHAPEIRERLAALDPSTAFVA